MASAGDILREAARLIDAQGWSQGAAARNAGGDQVPLFAGDTKARVNSAAVSFSIYGALVKANDTLGGGHSGLMWDTLYRLAKGETPHGGTNYVHPVIQFNEEAGRTKDQVMLFLLDAATACDGAAAAPAPPETAPIIDMTHLVQG